MNKQKLRIAIGILSAFLLWTVAVRCVDVAAIGPQESVVGFATANQFIHNLTGVHMQLYVITDWLGLVPILVCMFFALLGLIQWIKGKHLRTVDRSILILGGFYIVVMAVYILFEFVIVNYRPILIDGFLEASYPSSTTTLVMCVMPTAITQCRIRVKHYILKRCLCLVITAFILFMVIGRLISGVHWFSDIVGGVLLSSGLVMLYDSICNFE